MHRNEAATVIQLSMRCSWLPPSPQLVEIDPLNYIQISKQTIESNFLKGVERQLFDLPGLNNIKIGETQTQTLCKIWWISDVTYKDIFKSFKVYSVIKSTPLKYWESYVMKNKDNTNSLHNILWSRYSVICDIVCKQSITIQSHRQPISWKGLLVHT